MEQWGKEMMSEAKKKQIYKSHLSTWHRTEPRSIFFSFWWFCPSKLGSRRKWLYIHSFRSVDVVVLKSACHMFFPSTMIPSFDFFWVLCFFCCSRGFSFNKRSEIFCSVKFEKVIIEKFISCAYKVCTKDCAKTDLKIVKINYPTLLS